MNSSAFAKTETSEIQRLKLSLPHELHKRIVIVRSTDVNPPLIVTKMLSRDRCAIQVDPIRWETLEEAHRDLLFWHEVARVQAGTVKTFSWELFAITGGLAVSLVELSAQNLVAFSIALVVVGLASNQLYQRRHGERNLREATAADQGAIALAQQFGYSYTTAYHALQEALDILIRQTKSNNQNAKYQARLQVMEICARDYHNQVQRHQVQKNQVPRQPLNLGSYPLKPIPKPMANLRKKEFSKHLNF